MIIIFCKCISNQIKYFIILAVIRRSVQRVGQAHLRVIAPGHIYFGFEKWTAMIFKLEAFALLE